MTAGEKLLSHRMTPDGWAVGRVHWSVVPDFDYEATVEGMDAETIQREMEIDWLSISGVKVYPGFNEGHHVSKQPLTYNPAEPLYCGLDVGLTPAFVVTQLSSYGQWLILSALAPPEGSGLGTYEFGEMMAEHLLRRYATPVGKTLAELNRRVTIYCDPAASQPPVRTDTANMETDVRSHLQILRQGIKILVGADARGNPVYEEKPGWNWTIIPAEKSIAGRIEGVRARLSLLLHGGLPAMVVCQTCTDAIAALSGHHYKVRPDDRQELDPYKGWASHLADAIGYIATRLFVAPPEQDEDRPRRVVASLAANRRNRGGF